MGNSRLLLVTGALPVQWLGSYAECFLTAACGAAGGYREIARDGAVLCADFCGDPAPADPEWCRTSVRTRISADGERPLITVELRAQHEIVFRIRLAEGIRIGFLESGTEGRRFLKLTAPSGRCLYGYSAGCAVFDRGTMTLRVTPGFGRIGFLLTEGGADPGELDGLPAAVFPTAFFGSAALRYHRVPTHRLPDPDLPVTVPVALRETVAALHCELRERQSREGGFFLREGRIPLAEQLAAFSFLTAVRDRPAADRFLKFLIGLAGDRGVLPDACRADGSDPVKFFTAPDPTAESAATAFRDYARHFGRPPEEIRLLAVGMTAAGTVALRGGMMPFFGETDLRFQGSAAATLRFIEAAEAALALAGPPTGTGSRLRLVTALDHAEETFRSNFLAPDGVRLFRNAPEREKGLRRPHAAVGCCDGCRRFGPLIRKGAGYYDEFCRDAASGTEAPLRSIEREETDGRLGMIAAALGLIDPLPLPAGFPGRDPEALMTVAERAADPDDRRIAVGALIERCRTENVPTARRCRYLTACLKASETAALRRGAGNGGKKTQ